MPVTLALSAAVDPFRADDAILRLVGGFLLVILGLNLMGVFRAIPLMRTWRPLERIRGSSDGTRRGRPGVAGGLLLGATFAGIAVQVGIAFGFDHDTHRVNWYVCVLITLPHHVFFAGARGGYSMGPGQGFLVSEMILKGRTSIDCTLFDPARLVVGGQA